MSVEVVDEAGDRMTLLDIDGRLLPVIRIPGYDQVAEVRSMPQWKARDDDILICAYPKSGTHWIWEIVMMLLQGKAERVNAIKETAMLEGTSQKSFDSLPSPRVLNTHILYQDLPKDFREKHCKMIYLLRNVKDVAVSFFHHHCKLIDYTYSGKWENYLKRFIDGKVDYGAWTDHVLQWEKVAGDNNVNILLVAYEDMHKNPEVQVKRIAEYLGKAASQELIKDIVDLCSFKKMKKEKDPLEDLNEWKDKQPGMYRKGIVGDWKTMFTVAQNEKFDAYLAEKMSPSKWCTQYDLVGT
ncbi:hypothetical protein FSP39_021506 [Pinctada imbricata]|uniref:Sulfotransferase domain-containing protein n=1 Tax=Pinctada imbricata TaxID=66713 RepID=A0AA89BKY7_PINIB|nr:hypothetical protein FSP39_021506 [Pinctada imbricata]